MCCCSLCMAMVSTEPWSPGVCCTAPSCVAPVIRPAAVMRPYPATSLATVAPTSAASLAQLSCCNSGSAASNCWMQMPAAALTRAAQSLDALTRRRPSAGVLSPPQARYNMQARCTGLTGRTGCTHCCAASQSCWYRAALCSDHCLSALTALVTGVMTVRLDAITAGRKAACCTRLLRGRLCAGLRPRPGRRWGRAGCRARRRCQIWRPNPVQSSRPELTRSKPNGSAGQQAVTQQGPRFSYGLDNSSGLDLHAKEDLAASSRLPNATGQPTGINTRSRWECAGSQLPPHPCIASASSSRSAPLVSAALAPPG